MKYPTYCWLRYLLDCHVEYTLGMELTPHGGRKETSASDFQTIGLGKRSTRNGGRYLKNVRRRVLLINNIL